MVIIRAWNEAGYHKDLVRMSAKQTYMTHGEINEAKVHHVIEPPTGVRVIINPKDFPEMFEFEVIVTEERGR